MLDRLERRARKATAKGERITTAAVAANCRMEYRLVLALNKTERATLIALLRKLLISNRNSPMQLHPKINGVALA